MTPRPNASFGPSSWTVRFSTPSSSASARRSASQQFAAALPTRARVSEPVLPLVLAALHEELGRGLIVAAARGRRRARRRRGRGLVRRRRPRRALPVARRPLGVRPRAAAAPRRRARPRARGARSAAGSSAPPRQRSPRGCRPRGARPAPLRVRAGRRARDRRARRAARARPATSASSASRSAGSSPCAAGSSTSSRRPGASRSASSSSATRSSRSARSRRSRSARCGTVERGDDLPGRRATARARRDRPRRRRRRGAAAASPTTSCRRSTARPTSSGRPTRCARVWDEEGFDAGRARRRDRADAAAAGPAVLLRRAAAGARGARTVRGRERAQRPASPGARRRRRVPAPRRGAAPAGAAAPRVGASLLEPGDDVPRRASRSRSRPRAAASSGASSGSRCCPTPRSSASARRARPPRRAARSRASPTCAPATTSSTRTTASRSCSASRRRKSPASRATTSCSPSAATTGSTSRTSRSARSAATSAPTRKAPTLSKLGGKAWDNLKTRAREHLRELAGELLQLYAQRQTQPGVAFDVEHEWVERLEAEFPYRETEDQRTRDRGGEGGPRVAAPDGPPRLRRRRLRQDRGRAARRVRRRGQRQAGADARPDDRARAAALEHLPRRATATSPSASRWSRASASPPTSKQVLADFADGKVEVLIGTHRVLSRDVIPKELGLVIVDEEQRFGVAQKELLRQLRLEVDVLALTRDADPAHAAHVARRPARHLGDRDAAGGPPPDPHVRRRVRRGADQAGARARDRARRPGVLPAQPRRDDRGGRRASCSQLLPGPALPRRARADARSASSRTR